MEYNLCRERATFCDDNCTKCANRVYNTLTDENKILKKEFDKWDKERDGFINEIKRITEERNRIHERCSKLEKENDYLDQECESLLAKFSERIAELEKENNGLRVTNSELIYRNGLLMKTTAPNIFQRVCTYDELNDKIESLKEDIIRLDKCLSNRQCVQLERIKEERDGE